MVAGENDISVIRETTFLQLRENLPHAVIDEGNLTVIVGGHLYPVGLRINAGIFHAEPLLRLTLGLRKRDARCHQGRLSRSRSWVWEMSTSSSWWRRRSVERMVRVIRNPGAERVRFTFVFIQEVEVRSVTHATPPARTRSVRPQGRPRILCPEAPGFPHSPWFQNQRSKVWPRGGSSQGNRSCQ